ncbi:glutaredoxin family protein [Sutcliffiella horikoshii]|uniref:glutaredoxin family protein n=1 Tax=Sutcliffiella horikoshii TaxID=79883 RepID=UPI00203E73F3|nr:glutaredoxin family protein [Sutcliffiella horikoshii]MCM3618844.1 glutaredoxin family protein [Sutcliffiella horikoshii]
MNIQFYTKVDCPLCDKAKSRLKELQSELDFTIEEFDIYKDDALLEKYQLMIPVVEHEGEMLAYGQVQKEEVRKRLLEKIR